MFERHLNLIAVHGFMAAVCLSLLAGCGGAEDTTASSSSAPAALATSSSSSSLSSTSSSSSSLSSTSSSSSSLSSTSSSSSSSAPAAPAAAPLLAPTSLTATPGNAQVNLTWSASSGATSYSVKRSVTSGDPYVQISTTTSPAYTDTTASNGTTYFYGVAAVNSQGASPNSTQASATPQAPLVPPVPANLSATPGNAQVSLTWSASNGATSYHVKRAVISGGPYIQIAAPTSSSYMDTALSNGTTYYYVVSAVSSAGESANSAAVSGLPIAPPPNPPASPPPTTLGTWVPVTPSAVSLTASLSCGNFGAGTVQADPAHPSNLYVTFDCQGIWKSTDYGLTWNGPINTGTNGSDVGDCAGGISIPPNSTASVPTIYRTCMRGNAEGFWRSVDGGVNWSRNFVAASTADRQDFYPPVVDPYDQNHLLMTGHEMNVIAQSLDGGQTWTNVSIPSGMLQSGGTGLIFFINTGSASSTRGTWLWIAQAVGGSIGTWRTTNSGASWVKVDNNEHAHGSSQIYQPDGNGVVFMTGVYSAQGWGVLRSNDYGQNWTHVGASNMASLVIGTSKKVYSMYGYPVGIGGVISPAFEVAAQPGTGNWVIPATPLLMLQGPSQLAVVNDGTHTILIGAMYNSGLWRYVEP